MVRTVEQIENEINQVKRDMESLRTRYAQPYIQGFKKKYLWSDSSMEQMYNYAQSQLSSLLIEKHNLNKG